MNVNLSCKPRKLLLLTNLLAVTPFPVSQTVPQRPKHTHGAIFLFMKDEGGLSTPQIGYTLPAIVTYKN